MANDQHDLEESQPHVHDESNWLVSYADMMTLLFGFFVLMYSMARVDHEKFSVVSKDIAKFFGGKVKEDTSISIPTKDIREYIGTFVKATKPNSEKTLDEKNMVFGGVPNVADSSEETEDVIKPEQQIEIEEKTNTLTLKFRGSILFASGSAQLKPKFETVLNDLAVKLKASGRVEAIRVEGHTDDTPIKSLVFPTNWELSAARAARVVRQIAANGFEEKILVAEGFGSSRPEQPVLGPDGKITPGNRALNRRVVLQVKFAPPKSEQDSNFQKDYFERIKSEKAKPGAKVADSGTLGESASALDIEKRIQEAQTRLEEAQMRLKKSEEEDKKRKRLEDLERKLTDLTKKASMVEQRLKQKSDSANPVPPATQPERAPSNQ